MVKKSIDNVNQPAREPQRGKGLGRDEGVLELVHRVMHQYRARQYQALRDGPHDITHMEGKVLGYFDAHPGATQSDLARHTGRDKAQLARLIKTLRDQGLLEGAVESADRRSVSLRVTDAGRTVLRSLRDSGARLHARAVAGLRADEVQQLMALLQRVQANFESGD